MINLQCGEEVALDFSFVSAATSEPVTLENFHIAFFDLDNSAWGSDWEQITAHGADGIVAAAHHDLKIYSSDPTAYVARSAMFGGACGNPTDPLTLGNVSCNGEVLDQVKRSVMFWYTSASTVQISLRIGDWGKHGRNFMFGGE